MKVKNVFFWNSFSLLITNGEMLRSVKGYCMEVYFNSKMKQIEYPRPWSFCYGYHLSFA